MRFVSTLLLPSISVSLILLFSSCADQNRSKISRALRLTEALSPKKESGEPSCEPASMKLWDELYNQIQENENLPSPQFIENLKTKNSTSSLSQYSKILYHEIYNELSVTHSKDLKIKKLVGMMMGGKSVPKTITHSLAKLYSENEIFSRSEACSSPLVPEENPLKLYPSVYGAYKTFDVGYQSCQASTLTPLKMTDPDVKGIVITGRHPSGAGLIRNISDSQLVSETNPYYNKIISPENSACFPENIRPSLAPLIYDFGGKPYAASSTSLELDLFKNSGSGSPALGVDCSGFIGSSILRGGLRLKKDIPNRAYFSAGINSAMFSEPEQNGLSCFKQISQNKFMIKPGDLLAFNGHIVMIDDVSTDPFSLSTLKSVSDCSIEKMKVSQFRFSIIQSAPVLGGIGFNRMEASEYFKEEGSMKKALLAYASSYCKASFGKMENMPETTAFLVRHTGEKGCYDEQPLRLKYEECLKDCLH